MERYDFVQTTATESPATPHGEDGGGIPYTLPYSLTGWPCAVVTAGRRSGGLSIGLQIVGWPWRDGLALEVAAAIEGALGGWRAPSLS